MPLKNRRKRSEATNAQPDLVPLLRSTAARLLGWTYSGDATPDLCVLLHDAAAVIEEQDREIERLRRITNEY